MKIEIETKELAALINMIREQREVIGDTQMLADEIVKELPKKLASLNHRT